jgi:putative transcriptional regulator
MPAAPRSRSELDLTRVDWHRIDATDEETIARQAVEDPDAPPVLTPEEILAVGHRVTTDEVEDVRALRTRLGLSQEAFADRFGFSVATIGQVATIRQYESGRRIPAGPVRTLPRVIAREPDAVTRALAGKRG